MRSPCQKSKRGLGNSHARAFCFYWRIDSVASDIFRVLECLRVGCASEVISGETALLRTQAKRTTIENCTHIPAKSALHAFSSTVHFINETALQLLLRQCLVVTGHCCTMSDAKHVQARVCGWKRPAEGRNKKKLGNKIARTSNTKLYGNTWHVSHFCSVATLISHTSESLLHRTNVLRLPRRTRNILPFFFLGAKRGWSKIWRSRWASAT